LFLALAFFTSVLVSGFVVLDIVDSPAHSYAKSVTKNPECNNFLWGFMVDEESTLLS